LRENHALFIRLLKPLAVWMLFIIAVQLFYSLATKGGDSFLFNLLNMYVYMALAVDWHRTVILGPNNLRPVNLKNPQHNELVFFGMIYGIGFISLLVAMVIGLVTAILGLVHTSLIAIAAIAAAFGCVWISLRLSFYFPARAVDAPITLKQAFAMSKGYVWKMFAANFFATWRVLLMSVVIAAIALSLMFGLVYAHVLGTIALIMLCTTTMVGLGLAVALYMMPLLTVLWVNILSNYYLYARGQQLEASKNIEESMATP